MYINKYFISPEKTVDGEEKRRCVDKGEAPYRTGERLISYEYGFHVSGVMSEIR